MTGRVLQFKPLTCSKHNCSDFRELEILTQVEKNYAGKNDTWYYTKGLQASFPWNSEHRNTIKIKYFLTPEENFPAVLIYMKRQIGHVIKTL